MELELGLGIAAGRATQADLDLGPDLELSWQRGPLRLAAGALALVPRTQPVEDLGGVTLRTWMLAARVRAGIVLPLSSRVQLPISAALELGPAVARGQGVDSPRTVASPWLAAVGSARVVWRVTPRLSPWAGIDVLAARHRSCWPPGVAMRDRTRRPSVGSGAWCWRERANRSASSRCRSRRA